VLAFAVATPSDYENPRYVSISVIGCHFVRLQP
jgi:hypothetical protein